MCVGWTSDGLPLSDTEKSVAVNCFVTDPQTQSLVPNPKSMFRPYPVFSATVANSNGDNNLGNTLVTKLFPMSVRDQGVGTCQDWLAGNLDYFGGTGSYEPPVALSNPTGTSCSSTFSGPFQYSSFAGQSGANWNRWVFYSNYPDACGLANWQCATNDAGPNGKVCHLDNGYILEPSFLNFDRPEDPGGVIAGCPPKLSTGSHDGITYPGSLGSSKWVDQMPDGGKMPNGGPFPGAFVKLQYGTLSQSQAKGSCDPSKAGACSGGQGGSCVENQTTGEHYCLCKDSNATGDCSTCKTGYSMNTKTKTCDKDAPPPKKNQLWGISYTNWMYIGGGTLLLVLILWAMGGGKKQQAAPSQYASLGL